MGNLIDSVHRAVAGSPARLLATLFGTLLVSDSGIPPVLKDYALVTLQSLAR